MLSMKAGIPKLIIILAVVMIGIDAASKDSFMSFGLVNPWMVLVLGLDAWFLEKVKPRTLVYINKVKHYPVDQLISKPIKF